MNSPHPVGSGVKLLLETEKEAHLIIKKAREYRLNRLKEAQRESEKEIETLRQKKKEEFENRELNDLSSLEDGQKDLENNLEKELEKLKTISGEAKDKIIALLTETVLKTKFS